VSIPKEARLGRGFYGLVPVKDFLRNRFAAIKGRDRRKEFVGAKILALQHSTAAHGVTIFGVAGRVQTSTNVRRGLKNCDVFARDVSVSDQEGRGCEGGDARSNQVNCRSVFGVGVGVGVGILIGHEVTALSARHTYFS